MLTFAVITNSQGKENLLDIADVIAFQNHLSKNF